MGMWTRHRQRQAGRYARASYQLAVREANRTAAMRRVELLAIRANVRRQLRELAAANVPPRPDLSEGGQ